MAWFGAAAEAGPSTAQEEEDSGLLMQDAAPASAPASARKNLFAASNSTLSSCRLAPLNLHTAVGTVSSDSQRVPLRR